jgi:hypothetical protein
MSDEFNQLESPSLTQIPKEDISSGFSDIILRTMESDIKAIKQSGGSTSGIYKSAETLHIARPQKEEQKEKGEIANIYQKPVGQTQNQELISNKKENTTPKETSPVLKIILGIITILGFFVIGYFVLPQILPQTKKEKIETKITTSTQNQVNLSETATTETQNTTTVVSTPTEPINTSDQILAKFFKTKPEKTIELTLDTSIPNFNKYYNFLIVDSLENQTSSKTTSTNLFALILKDKNNSLLNWNDFLKSLNINFASNDVWTNTDPQFIGFIYKDKDGIWPGYILELNKNIAPSLVQIDLKKAIETDKNVLKNFFINEPNFTGFEFKNSQVFNREPIKILESKTKGAIFVYGLFFNKYIIISTSLNGLEEALRKM